MLKFGRLKFWSRAVLCVKMPSLPCPSFSLRVQSISVFFGKNNCVYSLPLCVQQACYTGGYRAENRSGYGAENHGGYQEMNTGYGSRYKSAMYGEDDLPPVNYKNLEPIKKDFYQEYPSVTNRSQSEIDSYLKENKVNLRGPKVLRPIFNFEESSFPEPILKALSKFEKPSVIQAISWPLALSGKDIISIAKTGSGKTLGFVLPAITHIVNQPSRRKGDGPVALIVLPTRELCQQVAEVAKKFGDLLSLKVGCVYGGAPKPSQASVIRKGLDLLVGTPGRLMDFLQSKDTNLRRCSFLVMDEADRMLDMGFEPQIRKIVRQIRPDRQTLMFSATWLREVQKMASDFQTDPVFLNVGPLELAANQSIEQHVEVVDKSAKSKRLFELLRKIKTEPNHKTIVFANRKREINELTVQMRENGFRGLAIHGGKSQNERDFVLNQFRSGKTKILVATDVAARGLDINDVKVVINYDYPMSTQDYVHRIGRTGRGEKSGTSYTLFTFEDSTHAADLVKVLEESRQDVPEDLVQLKDYFSK